MHGDCAPPNALVDGDGLLLADWEYADEDGSVLFDAWFLRGSIGREARHRGDPDQADTSAVVDLDRGIDAFGLRSDQVDACGRAMRVLMDFARAPTRAEEGPEPSSIRSESSKASPAARPTAPRVGGAGAAWALRATGDRTVHGAVAP